MQIITKYKNLFFAFSALLLVTGGFSLVRFGLRPSIDFTGGSILEVTSDKTKDPLIYHYPPMDIAAKNKILADLKAKDGSLKEKSFVTVGPILGKELVTKTFYAILLSIVCIAIYLGVRFTSLQYGLSAALATLHDALVVLGAFSILGHFMKVEVDVLFVTALLTILSFSVHDTIIVFDRIRERLHAHTNQSFETIVNEAALETLSRSIRNSLAIIFMLLMVFLLTSGALHWFVAALLIGTLTGTYSSTCVALPLLISWGRMRTHKRGQQ